MSSQGRSTRGRWRLLAPTAACVLALLAGSMPSAAQEGAGSGSSGSDDIDVLTSDRDAVRAELARLEARYAEQRDRVERARAAQREADAAVAAADAAVEQAEDEVEEARRTVARYAVEAYMRPPAQDSLRVLSISQADDAAFASSVIKILSRERQRVVDTLVAKQVQADQRRDEAEAAADSARDAAAQAEEELAGLDQVLADQQDLAARMDERLDAALAEAAALAAVDEAASESFAAEELALRGSGPSGPPQTVTADHRPAPSTPTAPQTTRPPTTRPPTQPTTTRPPSRPPSGPGAPGFSCPLPTSASQVSWSDVTNVHGIWVHRCVAGNVRAMLDAASAAGVHLRGSGYRDYQSQVSTRRSNCGPTHYDLYVRPARECNPPTAIPGRSMHEHGLALDLTYNGSLIRSQSSPGFVWLRANAGRYGFHNLPSEPWHWSTNGR